MPEMPTEPGYYWVKNVVEGREIWRIAVLFANDPIAEMMPWVTCSLEYAPEMFSTPGEFTGERKPWNGLEFFKIERPNIEPPI